jgi:hypothetical protein
VPSGDRSHDRVVLIDADRFVDFQGSLLGCSVACSMHGKVNGTTPVRLLVSRALRPVMLESRPILVSHHPIGWDERSPKKLLLV